MRSFWLLMGIAALAPAWARADEGMWTFDNFPSEAVKKAYGADVTPAWLDHVRLSTIRLSNCTASFVSPQGLILTNHHCVESCLGELSSKQDSLLENGFSAATPKDERRCQTQVADVLVATENVTATVTKAVAGFSDEAANDARKRTLTALEQTCEQSGPRSSRGALKCQAVTLYQGGQYFLYKYKRYDDVRLVFTPETDIAAFGGDPDNFQFPRWSLDFAVLRAYEHGKPARTPDHLKIDFSGPRPGELVFVSGHPGSTFRLETPAQLEFERDVSLPTTLLRTSELRGGYIQYGRSNQSDMHLIEAPLNSLENGIKVRRKLLDALHDDALISRKKAEESTLRTLANLPGPDPWQQIEEASRRERALYLPYTFIEGGAGFNSILFRYARLLLRRTPSGCGNLPTPCCPGSSSSFPPAYPSMRTSRRSPCPFRCEECANGWARIIPWCATCSSRSRRRRSRPAWWRNRSSTIRRSAFSCGRAEKPRWTNRAIR